MPFELPIFPLGVVLFPGMPLPLHIFEPRYRLMIARCLQSDQTFGVALITEAQEGEVGTIPASVGCTAQILEAAELDDGRFNLQTLGQRRFRILSLREEDDYLIGSVEWFDDVEAEDEAAPLANQALRSLRRYLGAIGSNLGEGGAFEVPGDAHALSMWIAALLAAPNPQKQELLELPSTAARLRIAVRLLQRAEIVQEAWARRQSWPLPESKTAADPAQFFSMN